MIHERYKDPIKVSVVFDGAKVVPKAMKWGKHTYHLKRVLNVHSTYDGQERRHIFSVATETEFFRLELNAETLIWHLVEHYQE